MDRERSDFIRRILAILAIVIVAAIVGHAVMIVSYNREVHRVSGADESNTSYLALANREDSTSVWLKRDFDLDGQKVDLTGQTFDGTLYNHEKYEISSWKVILKIKGDCYLNNAWCGTVEIHQHVGTTREKIQDIDLRKYELDDVKLDYRYDGDLLIPLSAGDYIVYNPSVADNEVPLESDSELGIGLIFYYLDDIDLSDYDLTFNYHREYNEGISFYIIVALIALWITIFFAQSVAAITYRRALKDMELRRAGVSYMSVIYDLIYIVDLVSDTLTPVNDKDDPVGKYKNAGVYEKLRYLLADDVAEEYDDVVKDFLEPKTLDERFDKESMACEFYSKSRGWCIIRLFAIDHEPGKPVERFIFALQNIDEERASMDSIRDKVGAAELEGHELRCESREYSFNELIDEVLKDTKEAAELRNITVETDIAKNIPDIVKGDPDKIRLAIDSMIISAVEKMTEGKLKLSVFSKALEDTVHLLISVRDSGDGSEDKDGFTGLGLSMADGVLKLMESGIHILREEGAGSELYFEIDQMLPADKSADDDTAGDPEAEAGEEKAD